MTKLLPCLLPIILLADGPKDNIPETVRPIPPIGTEVPDDVRNRLATGLKELEVKINDLRRDGTKADHLPDVEIFHKAVRYTLLGQQFYRKSDFAMTEALLQQGHERADQLKAGQTPWARQKGLVVRGYRSRLDGDVQPYGLVIPQSYSFEGSQKHRLDFWFHGRGERTAETHFIAQRQKQAGHFTPKDTIVLHPYGRYSNANKFAGEIDLFECLENARRTYRIDEDRILVRGFSMGGAACWQFAVHYADQWCAASPGAGFSETPEFLKVFQGETLKPTWYERKLWHLYDCTDWAVNLHHLPTIAYSGEKDRQKQAADMMEVALKKEGIDLVHLIGPGMGHKYDEASKVEIEHRLDSIAKAGRNTTPRKIKFTTWTLRYNHMHWVTVDSLGEHWKRARIDAEILSDRRIDIKTANITAFTLRMAPGHCPLDNTVEPMIHIDGQRINSPSPLSDKSWTAHFSKLSRGEWRNIKSATAEGITKRHGLQGPIDDAFMDSFMMVRPTGKFADEKVKEWALAEMDHAITHWRVQFRGDCRVKDDSAITDADITNHNLILWGDPSSNQVLKKIAGDLPQRLMKHFGNQPGKETLMPVLIHPNPLNPNRYVVVNSGFTYREYDYLNNARQVPKLPDWALIDINHPITSQRPGKIATAGFFDEQWRMPALNIFIKRGSKR